MRPSFPCRLVSSVARLGPGPARPLKLAIVGGGPSGFYAASRVLAQLPVEANKDVEVHVFERLPAPHGLVRYGVAPDHPEVKNVQHKFDLLEADPRFRYFGNVSVGSSPSPSTAYAYPEALQLPLSSLLPHYSHLLLSHGASSSASLPSISNSSTSPHPLKNVYAALAFVSWYNGHPAYTSLAPDLSSVKHVTIVGQGNVALDCARILLKSPDALAQLDVPEHVLDVLRRSSVETVEVVGRRGPGQVAFTTKEFREMMALQGVRFAGIDEGLLLEAEQEVERIGGTEKRMRKRLLGLMRAGSTTAEEGNALKTFKLSFLRSPIAFNPSSTASSSVPISSVTYGLNAVLPANVATGPTPPGSADAPPPIALAMPTGEEIQVQTDMVIESVGYRSEPIKGAGDVVPFDDRKGRIRNVGGRVVDIDGVPIANVYAAGWVARGPVGVIASTMYDSYSVADLLLSDHAAAAAASIPPSRGNGLRSDPLAGPPPQVADAVSYAEWRRIEQSEKAEGEKLGKRAEKIVDVREMLRVAKQAR